MKHVYLLWNTHSNEALLGGEDIELICVYTSEKNAQDAQLRAAQLTGFRDHTNGFEIAVNTLNKNEWLSGFITVK
jgi:hypothetical protein